MIALIESLDSLIVEAETLSSVASPFYSYSLSLCITHLRIARTILNSIR